MNTRLRNHSKTPAADIGKGKGKGNDECEECPESDLVYYIEQTDRTWEEHLGNVSMIDGCFFGAITSREEQDEVEHMYSRLFNDSGDDFFWFGLERVKGEVTNTSGSIWCWVRDPSLECVGAGTFEGIQDAPGFENWFDGNGTDTAEPNNSTVNQGEYAGMDTGSAGDPLYDWKWGDGVTTKGWHGLYQCW